MKNYIGKKCSYVGYDKERYPDNSIVLYEGILLGHDSVFKCEMIDCNIDKDDNPFYFECKKGLTIDGVRAANLLTLQ